MATNEAIPGMGGVELTSDDQLHSLEEGDLLERLTDQNRIPSNFIYANYKEGQPTLVLCYLPPEGTQPGDILIEDPNYLDFDPPIVAISPEGIVRGPVVIYDMTPRQAQRIQVRVMAHYRVKNSKSGDQ